MAFCLVFFSSSFSFPITWLLIQFTPFSFPPALLPKVVIIEDMEVRTDVGFREARTVRILFEEAMYSDGGGESCKLVCLSAPLEGGE